MPAKVLTVKEVNAKLDLKLGTKEYRLEGQYNGYNFNNTFKHKCGQTVEALIGNILSGNKKCSCIARIKTGPKTKTFKELQLNLDKVFGQKEYKLISKDYINTQSVCQFKHKCGNIITSKWQIILAGDNKCPCTHLHNFSRDIQTHTKEIQQWRHSRQWQCIEFSGSKNKPNTYLHKKCNKTFVTTLDSFKLSKGCPHCDGPYGTFNARLSAKEIKNRLDILHGKNQYKLLDDYKIITQNIKFIHIPCKTEFYSSVESMFKHNYRCPKCFGIGPNRIKIIKIKNNIFKCQGYEPKTLTKLLKIYKPEEIKTGSDFNRYRINYTYGGVKRKYTPDFYIKKHKLIVETKSLATLGLKDYYVFPKHLFYMMKKKAKKCIKLGYKFQLELYDDTGNKLIKLPKNWLDMSRKEVLTHITK